MNLYTLEYENGSFRIWKDSDIYSDLKMDKTEDNYNMVKSLLDLIIPNNYDDMVNAYDYDPSFNGSVRETGGYE